jgi:flavin-dependent dehydrogenase
MPDAVLRVAVAVLGGGPAGLATALSLQQTDPSLSVAVLERSTYEGAGLGESLPPTTGPLLRRLNVWESFLANGPLPAYRAASAWGHGELFENEFIYHPHHQGWQIDRRRFDLMLAREAARRGVRLLSGAALLECVPGGDGRWSLVVRTREHERLALEASFAVDATGRRALLARRRGAKKIFFDQLLGAVVFFRLAGGSSQPGTHTLVEACEDGWWYSSVLPDSQLVAAFMADADTVREQHLKSLDHWLGAVTRTRHTRSRLSGAEPVGRLSVWAAQSFRLDRFAGDGWLAAGDAASAVDPLSSHGVFKALRSGILASYAICDYFRGAVAGLAKYEAFLAREYEHYLATRLQLYGEERRWQTSPFWSRRQGHINLDPRRAIFVNPMAGRAATGRLNMHLPSTDLDLLCSLCRMPRPAHEVVAAFKTRRSGAFSDLRIILTLQYLLENEILCLQAGGRPYGKQTELSSGGFSGGRGDAR